MAECPGDAYFIEYLSSRMLYERGTPALPCVGRGNRLLAFLSLKCRSLVFLTGFEVSAEKKITGSSLGYIRLKFRAPDRGMYRDFYPQFWLQ